MKPCLCLCSVLFLAATAYSKQPEPETLAQRYGRLSCAVVQITFDGGTGTGFFINPSGDILTAADVALNRVFSEPVGGQTKLDVDYKPGLRIIHAGKPLGPLSLPKLRPAEVSLATADLTVLSTGVKTDCYLPVDEDPTDMNIGRHVIAIAYPLSVPSTALYEGFISARFQNLPIPIAIVNKKPIYPTFDVLRIQMPSAAGAAGGPIIGDDGRVIGVLTQNPIFWTNDLKALIQLEEPQNGESSGAASESPQMAPKLASMMAELLSSGAGYAVPLSYLQEQGQQPAQLTKPQPSTPVNKPCRLGALFGCYKYPTPH